MKQSTQIVLFLVVAQSIQTFFSQGLFHLPQIKQASIENSLFIA